MKRSGAYTLIQFCSDHERAEGINVGVALTDGVDTWVVTRSKFARDLDQAGSRGDAARVQRELVGLARRMGAQVHTVDELKDFISMEAGHFIFTPPRPMIVEQLRSDAEVLFERLVTTPTPKISRLPAPNLAAILDPLVNRGIVIRDPVVHLPIFNADFSVPYGFRNGVMNLIKPHAFTGSSKQLLESAMHIGARGQIISETKSEKERGYKLVVVGSFRSEEAIQPVRDMLKRFETKLVPNGDILRFAANIEQHIH